MRSNASREMINVEDRYFSLNRTLLLAVGLWPYEKSKLARIQFVCLFSILISCITFQLATLVTSVCTVDLVIKIFSFSFSYILLAIKYNSFNINAETVKYLMEQFQHIYENLKDHHEIAIVEKYGGNAKRFTAVLTMLVLIAIFMIVIAQLWQNFSHIILSVNQSQSYRLPIMTEYIDEKNYFYLLLFYSVATIIGMIALLATGSLLMAYLLHICALFRIASYRIANSIQIYTLQSINLSIKNKDIICAVDIHRKATTFSKLLMARFEISFMFLIAFGITSLSLNMFCIITSSKDNIEELVIFFINVLFSLSYMFLASIIGQEITDHNNYIFTTAYEIQWYIAPLHTQRLILFLLQNGKKSFGLKVGLLVASLQCFTTMTNASLSYFTVMYSMQQ